MSDCEHLIENAVKAITTAENSKKNSYVAFCGEMKKIQNARMLSNVSVTQDELWEMAYYAYLMTADPNYKGGE